MVSWFRRNKTDTIPAFVAPVGLYGKLPVAGEYFRRRCFRGASAAYREWIDSAQAAGRGLAGGWRLLFFADGYQELIVAHIRPSEDASKSRQFPISVFVPLAKENAGASMHEYFARAAQLWPQLERIDTNLCTAPDSNIDHFLDESPASLGESEVYDAANGLTLPDVAASLGKDGAHALARAMWIAHQRWIAIRAGVYPGSEIPAFDLPVAIDHDPVSQSMVWLRWFDRLGIFEGRNKPISIALPSQVSGVPVTPALRVLLRPPLSRDFERWLAAEADGSLGTHNFDGFGAFSDRLSQLVNSEANFSALVELMP